MRCEKFQPKLCLYGENVSAEMLKMCIAYSFQHN